MPDALKFQQITELFSGNDLFTDASKNFTYTSVVSEIKNAVDTLMPDIIYIGVGVGNPAATYAGTNPTLNSNVQEGLYDLQCFPAFLEAYKKPLSICINSSLDLGGKSFKGTVKVIHEGFPLNKLSDASFPALPAINVPVVVLNAVAQIDYPGIVDFAYKLGATYIKSYGMTNLGVVTQYYQFFRGKKFALKGNMNVSLGDAYLLDNILKQINE